MSASERARKRYEDGEKRRTEAIQRGMADMLDNPNGRALLSWLIEQGRAAEGKGSRQFREFARDLEKACAIANWRGLQIMREEWLRPLGAGGGGVDEESEPE